MSGRYDQDQYAFPPSSSQTQFANHGEKDAFVPGNQGRKKGLSKWIKYGLPLLIVVIIGAVVGGVVGSRAAKNNLSASGSSAVGANGASSSTSSSATAKATNGGVVAGAGATSASSAAAAASTAGTVAVRELAAWNWGTDKAIGMCLGNWLILERWMYEDWFTGLCGQDCWDEWDFTQKLGATAGATALKAHFNSWITEADIQLMYEQGINHVRIPTGFWAWIPTVAGEPYIECGQLGQIERILAMLHARGMYALIDLHGLPGSQNGEESSGHNTTSPAWFGNTVNQGRSDVLVGAVLTWLASNPYRSVVSGIEVINEPRPYTSGQNQELSNYYERSYNAIRASAYPVAMFLHPAFIANGFQYWLPFVTARVTVPPSIVIEDHPYPGNFPAQTGSANILSQVCSAANQYLNYPVPVAITEWSVYTGVKTAAFEKAFYESQLVSWAWSAGGMYWSYKHIPSKAQLADGLDYSQYSFMTLVQNSTGTIPTPASAGLTNTTTPGNAAAYLRSLAGNCGSVPSTTAPYNNGSIPKVPWTAQISALSVAKTQTLRATATAARRERKRQF